MCINIICYREKGKCSEKYIYQVSCLLSLPLLNIAIRIHVTIPKIVIFA